VPSLDETIAQFESDAALAHSIVHGADDETVTTEGGPVDSLARAVARISLSGTSTSSLTIGTGSKVFTTQANKGWVLGQRLRAASDDGTKILEGEVTAYADTSLTLEVDRVEGSGTHADWTIGLAGPVGATGAWLMGDADPAGGLGSDGDTYLQLGIGDTGGRGDVWRKAAGAWSIEGNIRGPAGPAEIADVSGLQGVLDAKAGLGDANSFTELQSFLAGAFLTKAGGGELFFFDSTPAGSVAPGDVLGVFQFGGSLDGDVAAYDLVQFFAVWEDATPGSEDASLTIRTTINGARYHEEAKIWKGLVLGAAAGAAQGKGTINVGGHSYRNGVKTGVVKLGELNIAAGGGSQSLTGIPVVDALLLVWEGVSHDGGSSQSWRIELSSNGGSTWGTAFTVTNAVGGANSIHGQLWVLDVGVTGQEKTISGNLGGTGAVAAWHDTSVETTVTGVINAIRVSPSGGVNGDAGKIRVWGLI
jgi:hypothetical protein